MRHLTEDKLKDIIHSDVKHAIREKFTPEAKQFTLGLENYPITPIEEEEGHIEGQDS